MGKKSKSKKSAQVNKVQNLASSIMTQQNITGTAIEPEFETLRPTEKGRKALDAIKRRRSKLTMSQATGAVVLEPAYDITPMSEMLDRLEDCVKDGKYGKGLECWKPEVFKDFLEHYKGLSIEAESYKQVNGMVKKLISIAKSYYEYDEKNREVMSNATYDGLLSGFLGNGNNEPVGIIPKGSKRQKKTAVKYPTLHNNVDKAYAIGADDKIPEGVKETDTVEAFLLRVYKTLSMGPETELELELSPKIDGVSVNGTVQGDLLMDPQTRGDNEESISIMGMNGLEVVTDHTTDKEFGIQYELFVTDEDRVKASEYLKLDRPYVSNRHAASGIMHRLCSNEDDGLMEFISLYPIMAEGLKGTYAEQMDYIENFGIVPDDMPERKTIKGSMAELLKQIRKQFNKLEEKREKLSFSIDGMVITVVDDDSRETLGRNDRTNKFQIALKFDPANAIATVKGIHLDSGKKGYRTVQVDLKHPVFLDGVRYDHVPVLSLNLFEKLELREGSKVNVHRVGDVIPSITVIDEGHGDKIHAPKKCPVCNDVLMVRNKKLYCANSSCKDNIIGKFVHFFEKMGMDGYGEAFAETLYKDLECRTIADVVQLTKENFKRANVTDKLALAFKETLEKAISSHYDYEILGAIGIPGVGPARARTILNICPFNKLPQLLNDDPGMTFDLAAIISKVHADKNRSIDETVFLPAMKDVREILKLNPKITESFEKNVRVGHTGGKLDDEIVKLCHDRGLMIVDGSSFDVLITSSKDRESAKMDTAKKKNLPVFLPDDFKEYYSYQNYVSRYL